MVLFIFAILLTQKPGQNITPEPLAQRIMATILSIGGVIFCGLIIFKNIKTVYHYATDVKIPVKEIGITLMGSGKYQYILPFEAISVLLLACIVGAIMIARKR